MTISLPMQQESESYGGLEEQCLALLTAYSVQDAAARTDVEEYDGWLDRVGEIDSVESSQMSALHGLLIAQGCLKFEFRGRNRGLQYQLASAGKQALSRGQLDSSDGSERNESSESPESQKLSA
jgi:hypothetical protein